MVEKISSAIPKELYNKISSEYITLLQRFESEFRFTHSQLKIMGQYIIDAEMWGFDSFFEKLQQLIDVCLTDKSQMQPKQQGAWIFKQIRETYNDYLAQPREYSVETEKERTPRYKYHDKKITDSILQTCPAASKSCGVCCDLKVLNVVENCGMTCTYCILQNNYEIADIYIPTNLKEKLAETHIDPSETYRIGTGNSSDSLLWGNRGNILSDIFEWSAQYPNIILELKTKSNNIKYLLENDIPANTCVSFTINPQEVISNEEHGTASLEKRLGAARALADKGIKVGFHMHPMMYYQGFEKGYTDLVQMVMNMFTPDEVLWFSVGTITLIRGIEDTLRKSYTKSKLLQMPTEETPDNKITYTKDIRVKMYDVAFAALEPWKNKVFIYLCMEFDELWARYFDYTYKNHREFNNALNDSAFDKIHRSQEQE
ncbi:MAG: hypothetical protein OCD01_15605 [Fibrobacterales bacterium]